MTPSTRLLINTIPGNRITQMTYLSGRTVRYGRDSIRRIKTITTIYNSATASLLRNRAYRADGLMTLQQYGNSLIESREYDQQGRLTKQTLGDTVTDYTYDANSNWESLTDEAGLREYGYDPLD